MTSISLLSQSARVVSSVIHRNISLLSIHNFRQTVDYSNVPKLNEDDLEEQFVRGHGPGGSNKNREIARQLLVDKLDQEINGELSVASQTKLLLEKKSSVKEQRRKKLETLKKAWKEREGIA
ncbi:hypothetical protein B566_EDAN012877 [Ephemera danica]|nr:hypothetical protein B566_EDAN012877 [Ephemera danica]